ncbi:MULTISPECIES: IS1/IS1595 family N-terminal zinc-binding domain-containing protein [unclassified Microcoleus]|uniref:IS1/IS1595 family N-terminal zinc-binding domain-containing protein n=1 Tax=unclassified Microcoleus TaxID=2642155 RepID=UPI002FD108F8
MNIQDLFNLTKLRSEVAMHQALPHWQSKAQSEGLQCPQCASRHVVKDGYHQQNRIPRYVCRGCGVSFTEIAKFDCRCQNPGTLPKCQDCPSFQEFLPTLKEKVRGLHNKNREELDALLSEAQSQLNLKNLRTQVARQEALSSWQLSSVSPFVSVCPHCQSSDLRNNGLANGKKRYLCYGCGRYFYSPERWNCTCQIPGDLSSCKSCPKFEKFLAVIAEKLESLQGLDAEQLQVLLK